MKLRSLRLEPVLPSGWYSGKLAFGQHITQLFGPNGCGKTPVIQSIPYALGYKVNFRDDVIRNCESVALEVDTSSGPLTITRKFVDGSGLDVHITAQDGRDWRFYNERDYSAFLFDVLGIRTTTLTSTGNEPTEPYLATFLPLFYLDQDSGYTTLYRASASFIKDQYAEMMRLAFTLPPKNSYERQKLRIEKKSRLTLLDRAITTKSALVEDMVRDLGSSRRTRRQVQDELLLNRDRLEGLKSSRSVKSDAYHVISEIIYERRVALADAEREIRDLQVRIDGFGKIEEEIDVEVATLSLNEEARRLFASFKDICANPGCGLFLGSSDSYGKNLLYLKDQAKDLQKAMETQKARVDALKRRGEELIGEITDQERRQAELAGASEVVSLLAAISELTSTVVDLQRELRTVEALETEESALLELLNERNAIQDALANLSGSAGPADVRAIQLRGEIRDRVRHWLDVLDTKNVDRDVSVDADFDLLFGAEKVSKFHGSTLTRVILAAHTAVFEVYTKNKANQMRFLILDTPRQQDIEAGALARYISELKKFAVAQDAQIIFSTTEYHYESRDGDVEWKPSFPGAEQAMFLGQLGK
jgi:hypothetical protein